MPAVCRLDMGYEEGHPIHPDEVVGDCGVFGAVLNCANRAGDAQAFQERGLGIGLSLSDVRAGGLMFTALYARGDPTRSVHN
jgi:hypothetical protein